MLPAKLLIADCLGSYTHLLRISKASCLSFQGQLMPFLKLHKVRGRKYISAFNMRFGELLEQFKGLLLLSEESLFEIKENGNCNNCTYDTKKNVLFSVIAGRVSGLDIELCSLFINFIFMAIVFLYSMTITFLLLLNVWGYFCNVNVQTPYIFP